MVFALRLQISRYALKNQLNAATDLQKIQYFFLSWDQVHILRAHPHVRRWLQSYKRITAMAQRRSVYQVYVLQYAFFFQKAAVKCVVCCTTDYRLQTACVVPQQWACSGRAACDCLLIDWVATLSTKYDGMC